MLKIYKPICLFLLLTPLVSCKDFLEKEPLATTVEESYYKTDSDLEAALVAAYDPMGWETDRSGSIYALPFFFGDVVSDDAVKGGSGTSDIGNFNAFETFTGTAAMPEILLPWERFYTGIYRANLVIANAPKSNASASTKSRVVAEAKFLRAYYHFELVKMYGDVPLVTKVLSSDEYNLSRSPKAEVYAQIEQDFSDAASALPPKGAQENGRATKHAAYALLARAQMYQTDVNPGKWNGVLTNSEIVINSGLYSLEPNFSDITTVAHEYGPESIFEINHTTNFAGQGGSNGSTWATGNEGTFMNVMFRGRNNGGWGFNVPSQDLVNEFKNEQDSTGATDKRFKATVIEDGDAILGDVYVIDYSGTPYPNYNARKFIEAKDAFGLNQSDGPSNVRVIRYADVLLMAAEAANELNAADKTLALKYLNMVRKRAGMSNVVLTDTDLLRAKIWSERRKELALEGHRFFDLVRQKRAHTVLGPLGFVQGKHEVFPIPQTERDLSKGKLAQNPGY